MKKTVLSFLIFCIMFVNVSAVEYYKTGSTYYKFDFNSEDIPHYSAISGEWEIEKAERKKETSADFENNSDDFQVITGEWSLSEGEYLQSEENPSATTRTLTAEKYKNFSLSFDLEPKSVENTMMIYFGYQNESKYNSIEINSYQSNLIFNGESITGKGSILKDGNYNIRLTCINGRITLYCNSEVIFDKSGFDLPDGRVGIGTWNSSMSFDDFYLYETGDNGVDSIFSGTGKDIAVALFDEIENADISVSVPISIKNVYGGGSGGIVLRADDKGNGYYFGVDKNSLYIKKKTDKTVKTLKSCEFKPRSGAWYIFSAICDNDKLIFMADDREMLSVSDGEFTEGCFGIFAENTTVYCKNIDISLIKKELPPLISKGNTEYYIDPEKGNDENNGKSPDKSWKSFDRLYDYTFTQGDKILLKKSGIYEGTFFLKNADGVTISSYGEGEKPVIISGSTGINIEGCKNITLSDVDIKLRYFGKKDNLWIEKGYGILVENSENIRIENCTLSGAGTDKNTVAVETDSKACFDSLETVELVYSDFGNNNICVNGIISERDTVDEAVKAHWAYDYMKNLVSKGILTEYRPNDKVTRAEFAVMLIGALELTESEYRGIFKDVNAEHWYASKLQTISDYRLLPDEMTEKNIASPDKILLREEAAAMAALATMAERTDAVGYTDISECEQWTVEYIGAVTDSGIMSGKGNGLFCPKNEVTRAEAAIILTKIMEYLGGEG